MDGNVALSDDIIVIVISPGYGSKFEILIFEGSSSRVALLC